MKFSVITVCYNSAETIRRTFDSVLAQNYDDYEYIVIDGASTDGTLDIIKEYVKKFNGKMRYVSEPDKGIYNAMNKGISMAKGEYLNMMNSDDKLELGALSAVAKVEKENPDAAIYYGVSKIISPEGIELMAVRYNTTTLPRGAMQHQSCFISNKKHDQYGLYDENKYCIAADYDFMMKLYKNKELFCPVDAILASFSMAGLSAKRAVQSHDEIALIQYRHGEKTLLQLIIAQSYFRLKYIAKKILRKDP